MSLRRTFHYPRDDDEDEPAEGIDEQEQEKVIKGLAVEDARSNQFYRRIFLTLPVLGAFYFVCIFFVFSGHANASFSSSPFLYACCLSSLLLSFAMMYHEQPFDVLTARNPTGETNYNIDIDSDTCLLVLNSMCCAIISICTYWPESMGGPSKVDSGEVPLSLSAIPVLTVFALAVIASPELRPVNLQRLEGMKYDYRGA